MLGLSPALVRGDVLRRLAPPGSSHQDPALAGLLDRLRGLVRNRDYRALTAMMAPDFRVEFDAGKGPQAFLRHWRPGSGATSLWDVLERLLSIDGYFYSETLFVVPYIVARYPIDLDLLGHVVAIRDRVSLLSQPAADAPVAGVLDHSIIPLAKPLQPPVVIPSGGFVEVLHPEFGHCFVSSSDVYHPAAHRAFFERRNRRWRWISLAAATLADPPDLTRARKPA